MKPRWEGSPGLDWKPSRGIFSVLPTSPLCALPGDSGLPLTVLPLSPQLLDIFYSRCSTDSPGPQNAIRIPQAGIQDLCGLTTGHLSNCPRASLPPMHPVSSCSAALETRTHHSLSQLCLCARCSSLSSHGPSFCPPSPICLAKPCLTPCPVTSLRFSL